MQSDITNLFCLGGGGNLHLLPLDPQTGSGKLKKKLFLVGKLSTAEFCSVLTNGCLNLLVVQPLLSVRTLHLHDQMPAGLPLVVGCSPGPGCVRLSQP